MYQNHSIMTATQQYADNCWQKSACIQKNKKTSFACEITSIERRTIFDLWQTSYAPRSSLRSLRYASQKYLHSILSIYDEECNFDANSLIYLFICIINSTMFLHENNINLMKKENRRIMKTKKISLKQF